METAVILSSQCIDVISGEAGERSQSCGVHKAIRSRYQAATSTAIVAAGAQGGSSSSKICVAVALVLTPMTHASRALAACSGLP